MLKKTVCLFCIIFSIFSVFLFADESMRPVIPHEENPYLDQPRPPQPQEPVKNPPPKFTDNEKPERNTDIEKEKTSLIIKSNVSRARVYINGVFHGNAPLQLDNLLPGFYEIRLEASGYETVVRRVKVHSGQQLSYYVPMELLTGILEFSCNQEDALFYVDGKRVYNSKVKVSEGYHNFTVRKFGYEEVCQSVYVFAHQTQTVDVELKLCDFYVKKFSCSVKVFNPEYVGRLGSCLFNAYVSAEENGRIEIYNSWGDIVFSYNFAPFTTWEQIFSWNGRDENAILVPAGVYTAKFITGQTEDFCAVEVDYRMTYPLFEVTSLGLGIGSVPVAKIFPKITPFFSIGSSPSLNTDFGGYAFPFDFSFLMGFYNRFEFFAKYRIFSNSSESPSGFNFGIKSVIPVEMRAGDLNLGFAFSYGYSQNKLYPPFGFSSDSGLCCTLLTGLSFGKVDLFYTTLFNFGSTSSNPVKGDDVWKNALCFNLNLSKEISLDFYGALHSYFALYNEEFDNTEYGFTFWGNGEVGFDFAMLIPYVSMIFRIGGFSYIMHDSSAYIGARISLNYIIQ